MHYPKIQCNMDKKPKSNDIEDLHQATYAILLENMMDQHTEEPDDDTKNQVPKTALNKMSIDISYPLLDGTCLLSI